MYMAIFLFACSQKRKKKINFESQLGIDALIFGNFFKIFNLVWSGLRSSVVSGFVHKRKAQKLNTHGNVLSVHQISGWGSFFRPI